MRSLPTCVVASALLAAAAAEAQEPSLADRYVNRTTYAVSLPIGDTEQFVSALSWMGVTWEGQWGWRTHGAGGFALGIHDFADRLSGTRNYEWGATTGTEVRDLVIVTAMGTGRLYLRRNTVRGPYVGLGAGLIYAHQSYQLGVAPQIVRTGFQPALAPEAGVAIPLFEGVEAVLSARYMMPGSAGSFFGGVPRSFRFLSFGVGLSEH
jgi:hypothetical protein